MPPLQSPLQWCFTLARGMFLVSLIQHQHPTAMVIVLLLVFFALVDGYQEPVHAGVEPVGFENGDHKAVVGWLSSLDLAYNYRFIIFQDLAITLVS